MQVTKKAARPLSGTKPARQPDAATAATVPSPAIPLPTPAPTVATTEPAAPETSEEHVPTAEDTTDSEAETTPANKRQQSNKSIGVVIASARIRKSIDKMGVNLAVEEHIQNLKATLAPFKPLKSKLDTDSSLNDDQKLQLQIQLAPNQALISDIEAKLSALTRERIRFSNESPLVLSIICDQVVKELALRAMENVIVAKKRIIQVEHLFTNDPSTLSLYPLMKTLPTFSSTHDSLKSAEAKLTSEENTRKLLATAEKSFRKIHGIKLPKKKPAPNTTAETTTETTAEPAAPAEQQPAADPEPETPSPADTQPDVDEHPNAGTNFRFYISKVCKHIIETDPRYSCVSVSSKIKSFLSDIVVELIQRLTPLVRLTASSMKNKTINDIVILRTVEYLLIDGHKPTELVEFEKAATPEPKQGDTPTPAIPGYVVNHTISYPTSGYPALKAIIDAKLALYKDRKEPTPEETPAKTLADES